MNVSQKYIHVRMQTKAIHVVFPFRILRSLKLSQYSSDSEIKILQEAALQLTRTVAPPCGHLQLSFVYDDVTFTLRPAVSHFRPFLDFPVGVLFQYFSAEAVLVVSTGLHVHV